MLKYHAWSEIKAFYAGVVCKMSGKLLCTYIKEKSVVLCSWKLEYVDLIRTKYQQHL